MVFDWHTTVWGSVLLTAFNVLSLLASIFIVWVFSRFRHVQENGLNLLLIAAQIVVGLGSISRLVHSSTMLYVATRDEPPFNLNMAQCTAQVAVDLGLSTIFIGILCAYFVHLFVAQRLGECAETRRRLYVIYAPAIAAVTIALVAYVSVEIQRHYSSAQGHCHVPELGGAPFIVPLALESFAALLAIAISVRLACRRNAMGDRCRRYLIARISIMVVLCVLRTAILVVSIVNGDNNDSDDNGSSSSSSSSGHAVNATFALLAAPSSKRQDDVALQAIVFAHDAIYSLFGVFLAALFLYTEAGWMLLVHRSRRAALRRVVRHARASPDVSGDLEAQRMQRQRGVDAARARVATGPSGHRVPNDLIDYFSSSSDDERYGGGAAAASPAGQPPPSIASGSEADGALLSARSTHDEERRAAKRRNRRRKMLRAETSFFLPLTFSGLVNDLADRVVGTHDEDYDGQDAGSGAEDERKPSPRYTVGYGTTA